MIRTAFAALAFMGFIGTRSAPAPAPVVTLAPVVVTANEPHPEIWAAIHSLEHAKEHLQHAAHDFGGHRVDAIHAIDAALAQLHTCLDFDK
ncbi:MAG TPA: hypothetical protein VNV25_05845 [Gemmatimonadaceae bacterium]|jgi:hypothetical protein|nr:hypothetical protein [Gemmatimonadaceae bacterium]